MFYILWTTDQWLMRQSFEFHGLFSSLEKALNFARQHQLLIPQYHILVDCGELDNYEQSSIRVFNTQKEADLKQLQNNTTIYSPSKPMPHV